MDNNNLNNSNIQTPQVPEQPVEEINIETINNNLEYEEIIKPGEELDDYHHEKETEIIDTKFLSTNKAAIFSIILAFVIPFIPILIAILALNKIKNTHQGGKILAIVAITINTLLSILATLIFMYIIEIGPFTNEMKSVSEDQLRICNNIAYGCDNDEDENGFKTCSYCFDGTTCNDVKTIECPTDELIKKTNKNNEIRKKLHLK